VWLTHHRGELLRCVVPLTDRNEEAAYASIKKALSTAADAVANVTKKNLRNPLGLFSAVSFAVENDADIKRLKKAVKLFTFLKDLKP
jgi:hypothetical protein